MKLIIGLGNPGREYQNTRHNIGFLMLDYYAAQNNVNFVNFNDIADYATIIKSDQKIFLLKPKKFMNLSGEVIREFLKYFKINFEEILVISDDLDLECGKYKLKQAGGSGGHNGINNIIEALGTNNFKKLKIGIGNIYSTRGKDYVLGKITSEESEKIKNITQDISKIIDDYITLDFENLMNKYNKR